ncbi:MAG: membrane protein insertion efficiency factor YidD [Elusimicrobiota bacterium]
MEKRKIIPEIEQIFIVIICGLVEVYRKVLSPLIGSRCRFYPSCSAYFIQSLKARGLIKGFALGVARILRCNPFNPGGYDPVEKGGG